MKTIIETENGNKIERCIKEVYNDERYTIKVYVIYESRLERITAVVEAVDEWGDTELGYGIIYDSGNYYLFESEFDDEIQIERLINNINQDIVMAYKDIKRMER